MKTMPYICRFCKKEHDDIESWAQCERHCGVRTLAEYKYVRYQGNKCSDDETTHIVPPGTITCQCGTLTLPGDFLK